MQHMLGSAHGFLFFFEYSKVKKSSRGGKIIKAVNTSESREGSDSREFTLLLYRNYIKQDLTNSLRKSSAYMNS